MVGLTIMDNSDHNKSIPTDRKEYLFKILVVGESGVGKTSIIKRYVHGFFTQHYKSTIGVDFALKVMEWGPNAIIRLQLWDIAGQERFGNMTRVYYKEAVGAFVVFDLSRTSTLEACKKWKKDLDSKVFIDDIGEIPIPVVLLGNKADLFDIKDHNELTGTYNGWGKTDAEMKLFCQENGFVDWFKTSAKDKIGIDIATNTLVEAVVKVVDNFKKQGKDLEAVDLNRVNEHDTNSDKGCIFKCGD